MRLILRLLLLLCLLFCGGVSFASAEETSEKERISELEEEVRRLQLEAANYEYLKEETESYRQSVEEEMSSYREFVQAERESFLDTINLLLYVGGSVIVFIGILITYFLGRSAIDMKQTMDSHKNTLYKQLGQAKKQTNREFRELLQQEMNHAQERIEALTHLVDKEMAYKKARVLVTGSTEDIERMKSVELSEIQKRGLTNIEVVSYSYDKMKQYIQNDLIDILILRYRPIDGVDPRMGELVEMLSQQQCSIPLLIYTYPFGMMSQHEYEQANSYQWSMIATLPTSLAGNLFVTAHAFHR
ncbi:hypothetical protein [Mechercharimyces sp. CAU 1602]|uniref:hypothetical protein n=1 Tax=Mechercharimyces sp. CAU 1602 TaxID=2973933 RepID=UPI0021625FB2|nr:hypothetical protein [Mechercharimyces sp. CAU 1602]MCS1350066.1 hypothetical protein [Mechercharimyces sp. CAU 1602]